MTRYRAYSRYDDRAETGMLVAFLIGSLIIFFLVIGVSAYQPTQCGFVSIRENFLSLDLDDPYPEIPEIPLPGPADYFAKPQFQIKIF